MNLKQQLELSNHNQKAFMEERYGDIKTINPDLQEINPFREDLSEEELEALYHECSNNPWYFFKLVKSGSAKIFAPKGDVYDGVLVQPNNLEHQFLEPFDMSKLEFDIEEMFPKHFNNENIVVDFLKSLIRGNDPHILSKDVLTQKEPARVILLSTTHDLETLWDLFTDDIGAIVQCDRTTSIELLSGEDTPYAFMLEITIAGEGVYQVPMEVRDTNDLSKPGDFTSVVIEKGTRDYKFIPVRIDAEDVDKELMWGTITGFDTSPIRNVFKQLCLNPDIIGQYAGLVVEVPSDDIDELAKQFDRDIGDAYNNYAEFIKRGYEYKIRYLSEYSFEISLHMDSRLKSKTILRLMTEGNPYIGQNEYIIGTMSKGRPIVNDVCCGVSGDDELEMVGGCNCECHREQVIHLDRPIGETGCTSW